MLQHTIRQGNLFEMHYLFITALCVIFVWNLPHCHHHYHQKWKQYSVTQVHVQGMNFHTSQFFLFSVLCRHCAFQKTQGRNIQRFFKRYLQMVRPRDNRLIDPLPHKTIPVDLISKTCFSLATRFSTSFPGSLFSASLSRWNRDPGCGWSRDQPQPGQTRFRGNEVARF